MILEVLTGKDKGRQIAVPTTGAVLGRGKDSDIKLDEPTFSRKHCRIVREKTGWVIQNLGSRSGVIINGQMTNGGSLKQHDEIRLGQLRLKVVSLLEPQCYFRCQCGKVYAVKAAFAGKTAVCKRCGAKTKVPEATASEDTIHFPCKCGKIHVVTAAFAGKTAVCKRCGAKTKVPLAAALASAAAAKTAPRLAPWSPFTVRLAETEPIDLLDIPPDPPAKHAP